MEGELFFGFAGDFVILLSLSEVTEGGSILDL